VRYGALRCVTVRYGALRLCVTAVSYGALRLCVTVRYGALRVWYGQLCQSMFKVRVTFSYNNWKRNPSCVFPQSFDLVNQQSVFSLFTSLTKLGLGFHRRGAHPRQLNAIRTHFIRKLVFIIICIYVLFVINKRKTKCMRFNLLSSAQPVYTHS